MSVLFGGVGHRWHKKLVEHGIYTAYDVAKADIAYLKAQFNVVLQRTAMELQKV
ncbi:DNA polymerase V, subunit C [Legionella nautarum]|uniref:DNA polymerase V, subunit C n=1 Tax=Legionella nautarum TaxID=45070 RepID=A0A0W0WTW8_9GAMM|nr:hypothetical protein [Legionella nautarum]KTD35727.1 DNA polymerase V, subunit C [Legionella nautarum]